MAPPVRKFMLTAHVTFSVGWLGAVATSLVLAVMGLISSDPQQVQATYLTLHTVGWFVLVPLSLASLTTGLVQALGTPWGLVRHYWVLTKLVMNIFATTVLLLYTQTLDYLADSASHLTQPAELLGLRTPSPVIHASGALLLLGTAAVLSIYKPRGLTVYGQRKQARSAQSLSAARR